jgi:hypothetical protein
MSPGPTKRFTGAIVGQSDSRPAYKTRKEPMSRYRTFVGILCIGLVLFGAFTPGVAAHSVAVVLDPVWDLFVPQPRAFAPSQAVRVDEQTRALLFVLSSRPPPISA